jgi:hypothetical protein
LFIAKKIGIGAGGYYQFVVRLAAMVGVYLFSKGVNTGNVAQPDANIFAVVKYLAQRKGNITCIKTACSYLVKKRLKLVIVEPVYQYYVK